MELGLRGVSVLVGGASSGLGYACVEGFLREGCRVTAVARGEEKLQRAAEQLRQLGEVFPVAADLSTPEGCERAFQAACRQFGPPLVVVINGGGPPSLPAAAARAEDFRQAAELLLLPAVRWVQASLPAMRQAGFGRVIAITSVAARQPEAGLVLSSSLRAAVLGYLKTLAREEARGGITFNAVCPGFTATERLLNLAQAMGEREGVGPEAFLERWAQAAPVGRLGRPAEVAAAVVFLASKPAAFINGVALAVDGGYCLSLL